jgi:hypothetical protein
MRYMYGLGTWALGDAVGPSRQVVDLVLSTICQKLIEAGLNDAGLMNEDRVSNMAALLTQMALQGRGPTPVATSVSPCASPPICRWSRYALLLQATTRLWPMR